MKNGNLLLLVGILAVLVTSMPTSQALGNESPVPAPLGPTEKLVGPTFWAVGVVTSPGAEIVGTLRVKGIEDCNVNTIALSQTFTGLIDEDTDVLWVRLPAGSVFGLCTADGQPIITKVKNFQFDSVDQITSFDAQIQFVVPSNYANPECD